MGSEVLLITIIGFTAILSYLFVNFKANDSILNLIIQGLGVGFIIVLVFFLPKIAIDEQNYCVTVVDNATQVGATTSFDYERVCFENTSGTSSLFYVLSLWFMRVMASFLFIYFIYYVFKKGKDLRFRSG